MSCLVCGAALERAPDGAHARCPACDSLFATAGGLQRVPVPTGVDPLAHAHALGFAGQPASASASDLPPDPLTATKRAFQQAAASAGATVRVGGVDVGLDRGGVSVSTERLERDVKRKISQKAAQWVFGCVFTVIFFGVAAVVVGGVGLYVASQVTAGSGGVGSGPSVAQWDGKAAYVCPANGAVILESPRANLADVAIKAGGNCNLTLVNPQISAGVAIDAGGNAVVTIKGGTIRGSKSSIVAAGNARVIVSGAQVQGPVKKVAGGTIEGM